MAELEGMASKSDNEARLANIAKYALAQFGNGKHVDEMIASATKQTKEFDVNKRVQAWMQLADVYYNVRKYDEAAKAHAKVIGEIEAVNPRYARLPSSYYNCACSLALDGKKEDAMKRLSKALELGKAGGNQLQKSLLASDMDIRSLRGTPEFEALMKQYFGGGAANKDAAKPASEGGADKKPAGETGGGR